MRREVQAGLVQVLEQAPPCSSPQGPPCNGPGSVVPTLRLCHPADSGRMNGKRKRTRRQRQNVVTSGPEALEWPTIQLSTVSSAPFRPLKEQTRLVQKQRGRPPEGVGSLFPGYSHFPPL